MLYVGLSWTSSGKKKKEEKEEEDPCIFIWFESTCVVSLVYKSKWINEESHKKIKGKKGCICNSSWRPWDHQLRMVVW